MKNFEKFSVFNIVFLLFVCWSMAFTLEAQTSFSKGGFLSVAEDTVAYNALRDQVRLYTDTDIDSAKWYARQLVQVANEIAEPEVQANAWKEFAYVFERVNEIDSVRYLIHKVLEITEECDKKACIEERFEAIDFFVLVIWLRNSARDIIDEFMALLEAYEFDAKCMSIIHAYMGGAYNDLGDYDEAMKYLNFAVNNSKNAGSLRNEMISLDHLSNTYAYLGDLEKAITLAEKCLDISQLLGETSAEIFLLYNLGEKYLGIGQLENAKQSYLVLLDLSKADENSRGYAWALLGLLKSTRQEDVKTAEKYEQGLIALLDREVTYGNFIVKRDIYYELSRYYLSAGENAKALSFAYKHLSLARESEKDTTEIVVFALQELTAVQAALGNYEAAWMTYDTFHNLKMAMIDRNQVDVMAQTSVEMDLAENELARQKAEQATLLEQQSAAARTRFFTFLLIMAGLILAGVGWAYRRAQHDKQLISKKNQQVEESLAEKEVLLREIHHRVKNNLQIISSLLDKQARKSSDTAVRKLVKEGQERIQSMALIHQNLYESDQLSGIDIKSYLVELTDNIQRSQAATNNEIEIELNVEDEKLDIDTAIPVGLILNELLTNSYKYAFAGQAGGKIQVDFKKKDDQYYLQVSDNGVGFTAEQAAAKTRSLGLNLVNGLVRQLEGTLEWLNVRQGAAVAIKF